MRKYRGGISAVENSLSEMLKINDGSGTKYLRIAKSGPFTGNMLNVTGSGKLWFVFPVVAGNGQAANDYVEIISDGKSYKSSSGGSSANGRPSCGYFSKPWIEYQDELYTSSSSYRIPIANTTLCNDEVEYFFGIAQSENSSVDGYVISSDPIVFTKSLKVNISLLNDQNSQIHIMYQLA